MENLYITIPAYNEEETIESVVREWYAILRDKGENSKLLVADSGSIDKTHEILMKLQDELPNLIVLSETAKEHGPKLIAMYKLAIQAGADYIFQTDSDGQTSSDEFHKFWQGKSQYDVILGNRSKREDGKSRVFVEKVVCILLKIYFFKTKRCNIPDANAPFRLMKSQIVQKYLDRLPNDYNIPNIMLTTFFVYYHENICFEEISFKPRQGGKNSINIMKIIKIGWKALHDFYFFKKEMDI